MSFRGLSFWRLLLVSVVWVVVSVAAISWKTTRMLEEAMASDPQQRGIAAVSGPVAVPASIVLGPPVFLIMTWLFVRWRAI